jgi:hypothetical protein
MIEIKSRKKALVAFAIVAVVAAVAVSLIAYPTFAVVNDADVLGKHVSIRAKGVTFQRIDSETIKQGTVELKLDVELERGRDYFLAIPNVSGSANVSGTIYSIESGIGFVNTKNHVALMRCAGVDAEGNEVTFGVRMIYFWWGGKIYALRIQSLLRTENPMLLLLRGVAKIE